MKCCSRCFNSPHLKDKINRNKLTGNCDFCDGRNVHIIDPRELSYNFQSIFDLYVPSKNGQQPAIQIVQDFSELIFSTTDTNSINNLLKAIFADDFNTDDDFFGSKIILSCNENPNYAMEIDSLHLTWENVVNEIKSINRFHIKSVFDFVKLEHILKINSVKISQGKIFYRGRISDENGYPKERMGNPPNHLAKPGRANPVGISYLYIANDLTTTLFETRAGLYDYISVGEFRLLEDIQIIDLKGVGNQDPFDLAQNELLEDYLAYLPFLRRLGYELSKPIRRQDSELDYLPTQYLTEFIKSIESDGISYGSSLNKFGQNLAIFHPGKLECIKVSVYEITEILYSQQLITK